jgi:hypothetical protein
VNAKAHRAFGNELVAHGVAVLAVFGKEAEPMGRSQGIIAQKASASGQRPIDQLGILRNVASPGLRDQNVGVEGGEEMLVAEHRALQGTPSVQRAMSI